MYFHRLSVLGSFFPLVGVIAISPAPAATFHRESLAIPESKKFTVSLPDYPGLHNPNPRGWYNSVGNVVAVPDGSLVAAYRLSDNHTALATYIMVARSTDGGRTWSGHKPIASANVWNEQGAWIAPQMSVLRDGRLVIICDFGHRDPGDDWPMLVHWQKPGRGMSNHLFWSSDSGRTWTGPHQVDDVGGEPGYILEMSNGTLAYTRTSSAETDQLKNPPMPWGPNYYRNEIVFSHDGGKVWDKTRWLADSPFHGDCEVGLAELAPGRLLAASRIGLGNGVFGHPSRILFSDDHGKTWGRDVPAPFYGQRVHVGKLKSGRMLATYRNRWGTPGRRAIVFDPETDPGFQPTSHILDESCCELGSAALTLRTFDGQKGAVEFSLHPAQDDQSRVEITATLRVEDANRHACAISAGAWVRFTPDHVCLADRPSAGFDLDARQWHTYRIVREKGILTILVDGVEKLREPVGELWKREVRFGNRAVSAAGDPYSANQGVSQWRSVTVKVDNADDYSIDWNWDPTKGYPDQFRRDRTVLLDHAAPADCGYSSWTQLADETIVILDYTTGGDLRGFSKARPGEATPPFIRSYVVNERDLVRE